MTAEAKYPAPGTLWRHRSGTVYEVLLIANAEAEQHLAKEWPVMVVYRGVVAQRVWARRATEWGGSFSPVIAEAQ